MIVFSFDNDIGTSGRIVYWCGTIEVIGGDRKHQDEIYEQLEAEQTFNLGVKEWK